MCFGKKMTTSVTKTNKNSAQLKLLEKVARKELIDMVPYLSARRLQAGGGNFDKKTWLNANEASGAGEYQLTAKNINRYPDFQPEALINAYADYANVEPTKILSTRGADEGIELIIRTFCQAYQDDILICPPTYGMYAISAENHGAGIIKVPLIPNVKTTEHGNCQLDVDAICQQVGKVNVVFLCSPGNPTGNLLPHDQIKQVIEAFADSAMVVVDEAYIEFSRDKTVTSWLADYENLIVLRTLSKAFALAGLRCGFTIANDHVIELIAKVIAPYPVPAPIAELASQALSENGLAIMQSRVTTTNSLKDEFVTWLTSQHWCEEVFPSDANFVLFRTQQKQQIFDALIAKDILIRDQSKQIQLDNCLRVSIGSEAELSLVKQTITQMLAVA
jgi:histidinol-phosphate aminotransferase